MDRDFTYTLFNDRNECVEQVTHPGTYTLSIDATNDGRFTGHISQPFEFVIDDDLMEISTSIDFSYGTKITLTWTDIGAESYSIWRSVDDSELTDLVAQDAQDLQYIDTDVEGGHSYTYTVKAIWGPYTYEKSEKVSDRRTTPSLYYYSTYTKEGNIRYVWWADSGVNRFELTDAAGKVHAFAPTVTEFVDKTANKHEKEYSTTITAYYFDEQGVQYSVSRETDKAKYVMPPTLHNVYFKNGNVYVVFNNHELSTGRCYEHDYRLYRDDHSFGWGYRGPEGMYVDSTSYYTLRDDDAADLTEGRTYRYYITLRHSKFTYWLSSEEVSVYVPGKVSSLKLTPESSGLRLSWKTDPKVKGYTIYRKKNNGAWAEYKTVTGATTCSYLDKSLSNGSTYSYRVYANAKYGSSYRSDTITQPYLSCPSSVKVSMGSRSTKVSWKKNSKASGYYVYRMSSKGKTLKKYTIKKNSTTSYTDKDLTNKKLTSGYYKVYAYVKKDGKVYTSRASSFAYYCVPAAAKVTNLSASGNGLVVTWNKATYADGYYVWQKKGNEKWKKIRTISATSKSTYTAKSSNLKNGTMYAYKIETYAKTKDGKTWTKSSSSYSYRYLTQPTVSLSSKKSGTNVQVSWKRNSKADGYKVYRKVGDGSWTAVKTITSNKTLKWTDTQVDQSVDQSYMVRAYEVSNKTTYYSATTNYATFPAVEISS